MFRNVAIAKVVGQKQGQGLLITSLGSGQFTPALSTKMTVHALHGLILFYLITHELLWQVQFWLGRRLSCKGTYGQP